MKCETCSTEFVPITYLEDYNQASGCAATLYLSKGNHYILAHYGSAYDMQRYALKRDKYETGDICDVCIKKYIECCNAHLIEDGVW
jgi:hypothetical protein